MYCPKTRINVLNVLKSNPKGAAIWFKTRNYITESNYDFICMDPTMSTEKADKLLDILVKSPDRLQALISYLREEHHAQLATEIENGIDNPPLSSGFSRIFSSVTTKQSILTTGYDSATCKFISDLKQFTRQYCEVIRRHWKDNLTMDDLEHAYVPLTLANEKELSPKYTWNHDDLQNLAFLYVDEVRIFITGEPGFGKSTFLNKIAYDWAADKNPALTQHFDFVYYLPLSEATGTSLSESILSYLAFDDKENSSGVISRCFTQESYRSRTLFLLDAYDEVNPTSFTTLTRIAEGSENPLSKCVITSRPLQVDHFEKPIHISARGFDVSAQFDYITNQVHDPELRAQLLDLEWELFESPFFLTVVCLLANHHTAFNFQGQSALFELLKEYHEWLYVKAVENKKMQVGVEDYKLTLIEAGKFALQEKLHSSNLKKEKDLTKHLEVSVESSNDHTLLKQAVHVGVLTAKSLRGVANPRIVYGFRHLLLVEYLCAVYLNHLISSKKTSWWTEDTSMGMLAEMLPKLLLADYGNFRMVSYFLSGLSKDYFHAVVQHLLTMSEGEIRIPRLCDSFELPQYTPRVIRGDLKGSDWPDAAVSTVLLAALLSGGSADRRISLNDLNLQSGWLSTAVQFEQLQMYRCTIPSTDESCQMGTVSKLATVVIDNCYIHSLYFLQHLTLQELTLMPIVATDKVWLQLFAVLQTGLSDYLQMLELWTTPTSETVVGQFPAVLARMKVLRSLKLWHADWYTDGLLFTLLHNLSGTLEVLTFYLPYHRQEEKVSIKFQLAKTCTKLTSLTVR